ncbi:MAG: copper chaperone PCu(A)C [Thiohalobacterales bacterium]|nr:copper chaperone PCu(A)C [Thiohalobacterales bacterium]
MKMRMPLCALLLLAMSAAAAGETLEISDAWIREAPPGARVHAGYLQITNHGSEDAELTGVSGDDFGAVEIHRTVIEDGMASMHIVPRLTIPSGGGVALEPGRYHLMLFRPSRELGAGATSRLLLLFSNDSCRAVTATVRRDSGDAHP